MQSNKKMLLVGQFSRNPHVYCYADSFVNSFRRLGYVVEIFAYYPSFKTNILSRLYAFFWQLCINIQLLFVCFWQRPDILFVLKGEPLFAKTVAWLKRMYGVKIIWFYPDSPFIFWNGNSNSQMLKVLPSVDLYLCWSQRLVELLFHAGAPDVEYFPFGFDSDIFFKKASTNKLQLYKNDLLFVGTWSKEREHWLTLLVEKKPDISLVIFGTGWKERQHKEYRLTSYIHGDALPVAQMVDFFSASKIVLNFLRPQNFDSHNMRSIEVPATGNFLLAERSYEHAVTLFEENKEIVCFSTIGELIEKIEYYISHEEERLKIACNAHAKAQEYSLDLLLQQKFQKKELVNR
ncbi:glycosyltransferase [Candidatus Babeliales bacterium]|nr:glycosyltransferase [Candidatus Babeliales bacterium]